ncbi:PAS domain S-box protein [Halofilum ochraceum]|uniref:PAS domain S-box protein n=1 Tax=Halofilum ochraceum TaxID=1611323 RepID=UPI00082DAD2B|nr:PAS domain S-box protein [Halofilum ochraceum]
MVRTAPPRNDGASIDPDLLFELIDALVAVATPDGQVIRTGTRWCPPGAARVKRVHDFFTPADQPTLETALTTARDSGHTHFEATLATTGHRLAVHLGISDGLLLMTAQPPTPNALVAESVMRLAGAGLTLLDEAGYYRYVNDAYCAIYGYRSDELLGRHFTAVFPADERATAMAHHRAVLQREREGEARELWVERRDGSPMLIDTCSRRIDLPDGEALRLATVIDITGLRAAERRLADTETRLHDITDSLPGAIYQVVLLPDGRVATTYMSEGLGALTGLPQDADLADFDTVMGLIPPRDARLAMERLNASARDMSRYEQEFPLDGPIGRRWIQARSQPHPRADGAVVWNGLMIDITARREAEDRLAEAERRLRAITGSLPGAIYQFRHAADGTWRFTYMSDGLRRICGLPDDYPIDDFETFLSLVPDPEREDLIQAVRVSEQTLAPLRREFRLVTPNGTVQVEARSVPQPLDNGEIVCNGLLVDVTDRQTARAEADRLNAILESTPDCVAITDTQGDIHWLNAGGRALLELADDATVTGRSFFDFVSAEDRQHILDHASVEAAHHGTWSGEATIVTARGRHRRVSQTILSHRDPSGRIERFSTVIRDLSERVAVEADLRASEERFRLLYHHTPTMMHSIDAEGRLVAVSDYWLEQFGYTREEVIGRQSIDLFTPESRRRALEEIRPTFWRDGRCRNIPFQIVRADGEIRDVLLSADCEYDHDGNIVQAVSVMADVSDRMAIERELAASEARFRSLYDNTPVMMHSIDRDGRIIDVNDYWLQHLGYPREEVIGAYSRDFLSRASREKVERIDFRRLMTDGVMRDEPMQIVRADGQILDILLSATVEYDDAGRMLRSRTVMIDVTEQLRAESDYQDIFENATEGIYRSSPDGRLLRANPALARLHGYDTEAELLAGMENIHAQWFVDSDSRTRLMEALERHDRVTDFEAEITRLATGERIWTSENARAVRGADGRVRYYEGTVRDITAQYRAARLAEGRGRILEMIARDRPLNDILRELVALIERQHDDLTAAIFRLRDGRLQTAAAPRLPAPCTATIDGQPPEAAGSAIAGTLGADRPATDELAEDDESRFRRTARDAGFRAISAVPVRDQQGATLAVVAALTTAREKDRRDDTPLLNEMAQIASIAIEQDRLAQELVRQAQYDTLTDLPNRALLTDRLERGILDARRSGEELGVLLLDLDEFKLVNDTLGHSAGDQLLQQVAARLRNCVRDCDTVARLGGDEFVIAVPLREELDATEVAERVLASLQPSVQVAGRDVTARPSIGISIFPQDGQSTEALMQTADTAMYAAKHAGKNRYRYFAETMNAQVSERLRLEAELRTALAEDQLELYYQPQIDLPGRNLVGAEALLRWNHPERGPLTPGQFLPVAERGPLIGQIDRYVLRAAARVLAEWQAAGEDIILAANISARELHSADFGAEVAQVLADTGVDPNGLELEITESMLMVDFQHASRQLNDLKARAPGLRIAIDDFGSGYSSLNYLRHLPIDTLKVDRAFVADIDAPEDAPASADTARAIVRTIVELGRSLGLTVIAEGVETAAQADLMQELGCHNAQGYWFDRPLPHGDFEDRLRQTGR